jgi:gluconolactonase
VQTTVAAEFNGKRFNSPNDLVIRKNGDVYFTDPPYGLANLNDTAKRTARQWRLSCGLKR